MLKCPKPRDDLDLYLSVNNTMVASILMKEEKGKQWLTYCISHTLQDAETRYPTLQNEALALVYTVRKLKSYFQAHVITLRMNLPLKDIL